MKTVRLTRSSTCPMDRTWRQYAPFGNVDGRLDPEVERRVDRARRAQLARRISVLKVDWQVAPDDESMMPVDVAAEPGLDVGTARHVHADIVVLGQAVHLDVVEARRSNPTFAFRDFRLYVAGVLAGRALQQQCGLGAMRSDLPAVAVVGDAAVTLSTCGVDRWSAELWAVTPLNGSPCDANAPGAIGDGAAVWGPHVPGWPRPHRSPTVWAGILTEPEFDALSADDVAMVERTTQEMIDRYGDDWLAQQRAALRQELLAVL